MSEIKVNSVVNSTGDNDSGLDLATNDQVKVKIANAEDFIFKANSLEVQTGSNIDMNGTELILDADGDTSITADTDDQIDFKTGGSDRVTIDSSGNLLVGTTNLDIRSSSSLDGMVYRTGVSLDVSRDGGVTMNLNRLSSDGAVIQFRKDGSTVGDIRCLASNLHIQGTTSGLSFQGNNVITPVQNGARTDNVIDLGDSSRRFDDIFATNGTIQTSDENEKNTITDSDLGLDFVNRLAPKSYIFNGKTRTHYGLIAQDVETVLSDISKETSEFAGFIKTDISEGQDGSQYRYGLRYTEFVGILIKALQEADDKIDALTARIEALEA